MTVRSIGDVGEFAFLSRLLPQLRRGRDTVVGPGQDCAVIRCGRDKFLLTIDALVEGTHFEAGWLTPYQIGRKGFLVNASDAAAMGGAPRCCVVSLCVPRSYPVRDLFRLQAGIAAAAAECGASIVGGNLARADTLNVSIALLAAAPRRIITRQGARPGDRIYVTGTLGDAAVGLQRLREGKRSGPAIRRFREPTPRLHAGQVLTASHLASSMIDVSDGLVQDLGHLCEQSRVGAVVHTDRVPLSPAYRAQLRDAPALALHGGEDYELLCTIPERHVSRLKRAHLGCPITCIGEITATRRVRLLTRGQPPRSLRSGGYDHFRQWS